jgi:hypothetical protein
MSRVHPQPSFQRFDLRKTLMPRLKAPAPDVESRKALEQRAREATLPAQPQQKGRWPFPVTDDQPAGEAQSRDEDLPEKTARAGKSNA